MQYLSLQHQRFQGFHRLGEIQHRWPHLDHGHALGEHSRGELGGLKRIEGHGLNLEPTNGLQQIGFDPAVINDVARCDRQAPRPHPASVLTVVRPGHRIFGQVVLAEYCKAI